MEQYSDYSWKYPQTLGKIDFYCMMLACCLANGTNNYSKKLKQYTRILGKTNFSV